MTGDLFFARGYFRDVQIRIVYLVGRVAFQFTDGNGLILFGPTADFFARVGTNAAQHAGEGETSVY